MKTPSWNLIIPHLLLFTIFISFSSASYAQQIVQVGAGEYFTSYRTSDGQLYATKWGSNSSVAIYNTGLTNVVDVAGAQYTNVALEGDGSVYVVGMSASVNPYTSLVATDNLGKAFKGNTKVYGLYQCYLTIRNGNVWYWGTGDVLGLNGGANITAPVQLNQPAGKTMVKLVTASATTFGPLTFVWGLASDGTVWQWDRSHLTPFQVTFTGGNIAQDITMVGPMAFVIKTSTDLLTWGYEPTYAGGVSAWQQSGIQSIKAVWQNAGCVFPVKEIVGNYNTLHIIDANNNMFASGSNPQGEIGNGIQYSPWISSPTAWQWDWGNGEMMTGPVQIPGKFKNINTSNTITFYLYAQDMGNNWYSWGRNKALSLGNGLTLSIDAYAIYPEALNVPAPTLVTPLTQTWQVINFSPNNPQPVLANAGVNQYINSSSTTLYGSGSSQQNGTIKSYAWTKVSGTGGTISSPSSMNTAVTGLANGSYIYQLTVTNNLGAKASSNVSVVVGGATNIAPLANAGNDTTLVLPANSVKLTGKGSDPDGSINSYLWKKVSGPSAGTLSNATSATATFSGMTQGLYGFELTVTDNNGATGKDTIWVTVNAAPVINLLPASHPSNTVNGLDYKYYEGSWSLLPLFSSLSPVKTGTTNTFSLTLANKSTQFGFNFTGYISVPADGQYTFYSSSDDGSGIYIDNVLTVLNDGLHGASETSGTIGLKAGKHAITALFFQQGGKQVFVVSYQGPSLLKQVIPASALYRVNSQSLVVQRPSVMISDNAAGTNINGFKVYPNPVNDMANMNITTTVINDKISIAVYNLLGMQVKQKQLNTTSFNTFYKLDMSGLNTGMYYMVVRFGNGQKVGYKILKSAK